jgi:hypothetical protein
VDVEEQRGNGSEVGDRHLLRALGYAGQRGKMEGALRAQPCGNGRRTRGGAGAAAGGSWAAIRGGSSRMTDKRGRASRGLSVSGGVREGERRARQCDGGAPTCGIGRHGLNGFESIQTFKRDQNDFIFLQTLTASNRTFPDSKNYLKQNTVGKYLR